jgi:pimeloyl-ACP methyl ester carboxylesterase
MELMNQRLHLPLLALRGADDPYILDHVMAASHRYAAHMQYRPIAHSGHFAHQEQPDVVTEKLLALLRTDVG